MQLRGLALLVFIENCTHWGSEWKTGGKLEYKKGKPDKKQVSPYNH